MISLLVIVGLLVLVPIHDLLRRGDLRRVAMRNVSRRLGETSLVIVGSLLGTAIITAAFITGDTFDKSIRDIARTDLGPIDEIVLITDPDDTEEALALLAQPMADVDGVLPARQVTASIAGGEGSSSRAEPNAVVASFDFEDARSFGTDPSITGLVAAGETPGAGQVVLNASTAETLDAQPGEVVDLFVYNQQVRLTVTGIVPDIGIAGANDAFVAPGLLEELAAGGSFLAPLPDSLILVSNTGGVFDAAGPSDAISNEIEARLRGAGIEFEMSAAKQDILDDAGAEGAEITELFTVVGGFSVLAGVLLLVNLFVMLAEERKPTLGVLRAVGWRRGTVVRSFALEGALYAVAAAAVGTLLGIGVGWVIVQITAGIFTDTEADFALLLAVEPGSLLVAGLVGLAISMAAIWATSLRISRLNIIRAIRDLPEPVSHRRRRRSLVGGSLLSLVGGFLLVGPGLTGGTVAASLVGPPMALLGLAVIGSRWIPGDRLALAAGAGTVAWGVAMWLILPASQTDDVDIAVFLLLGVVLVAGGVAIAATAGGSLRRLLDVANRPSPTGRIAMAYPSAQRFRTGVSLATFTLVVFSLTFMAVMSQGFASQVDDFTAENAAGHDILLSTNPSSPVSTGQLLEVDGVTDVTPVVRAFARFSSDHAPHTADAPEFWSISGATAALAELGVPELSLRASEFSSDEHAFLAVTRDPTLAIVPSWFLADDGEPEPLPGSELSVQLSDGTSHRATVVGVVENDFTFAGVWLSSDLLETEFGDTASLSRYYVATDRTDVADLALELEGTFVANGVDAESFTGLVDRFVTREQGFFNLLSGYLALGLIIGIAGLGVVLVRAVRERRRQIGMLRAMGMQRRSIRAAFVTEGSFVTLLGVVTGVVLGLGTAFIVLTKSSAAGDFPFVWPVGAVTSIIVFTLAAAVVMAAAPAARAARMRPSEALRLTD